MDEDLEKQDNNLEEEQEKSKPIEETTPAEDKKILEEAKENVKVEDSEGESNLVEKEKAPKEKEVPNKKKEGSFKPLIFVMIASMVIAIFWDSIPFVKDSVHAALNPTAGALLNWNLNIGMLLIVFIISLFTTLIQKYATDQKALKELRKEQKILQDEMKKYKEHPEKVAELSKKQLEFIPQTFKLTSRGLMFTGIPFILFFRWFRDFFEVLGDPKFFGFMTWFWFYLIFVMIFSSILRKVLKVV